MGKSVDLSKPLDCGHYGTFELAGYALDRETDRTMCYPCATARQVAALLTEDKVTAYMSGAHSRITTWNGDTLGHVVSRKVGPERCTPTGGTYRPIGVLIRDVHGQLWTGRGSSTHDVVQMTKQRRKA